jgi:hypothetical protein
VGKAELEIIAAIWNWAWPIALSGIGLLLAWFVLHFVGRPLLRFKELRSQIENARIKLFLTPIFTGPVVTATGTTHPDIVKMDEAKAELRRLGFEMMAFGASEMDVVRLLLRVLGFDATAIGRAAAAFANQADAPTIERMSRDGELRKALRIKFRL